MNTKTVVLNAKKMNFDGKLDFSILSSEVVVYDDTTPEELLDRIEGADVIVTKEMPVNGELIRKFPSSVKLICEAGTGYNNLDLDAAREKGIMVCNIPAYSTQRVAQTAIMLLLNLSSTMQVQMAMLAKGNHDNFTKNLQVPHVEVNDKTLGIIGAGHIGQAVIRAAQALDMNILVYTRTPKEDGNGIRYVDLETLLKNSDYVSLHCPLTPQTRHLINKDTLALMKPEAFLINTSRGSLVDEPALIEALQNGTIAGAVGSFQGLGLLGLLENLSNSEDTDHDRDHLDTGGEQGGTEGQTGHAQQGVDTEAGQEDTQQAGDDGTADVISIQAGEDGQAHEGDSKQLGRTEAQSSLGQLGAEQEHAQSSKHTADGGANQRNTQGFTRLALLSHGIAVEGGGRRRRNAGDLKEDSGDTTTGDGGAVDGHQERDALNSGHAVGKGNTQSNSHGSGNAGEGAEDNTQNNGSQHHDQHLGSADDGEAGN